MNVIQPCSVRLIILHREAQMFSHFSQKEGFSPGLKREREGKEKKKTILTQLSVIVFLE